MSKKIERVNSSLQLDEDIGLHETGWVIQRVGWGIMLAVLIFAILGLFGNGMLSEQKVVAGGITVVYEKYLRSETDTEFEIIARDVNGKVQVTLSPQFNDLFKIDRMTPEPSSQNIENGSTILDFSARGEAQLVFFLSTREGNRGNKANSVIVNNTDFTLDHYIYP